MTKARDLATSGPDLGLIHLHTETFSAVTSIVKDNIFTSTYKKYLITMDITVNTAVDRPIFYFRSGGVGTSSGIYMGNVGRTSSAVALDTQSSNGAYIDFNGFENLAVGDSNLHTLMIQNPAVAKRTSFTFQSAIWSDNSRGSHMSGGGVVNNTTVYDGFSVNRLAGSGTFTGTLSVYGYKE